MLKCPAQRAATAIAYRNVTVRASGGSAKSPSRCLRAGARSAGLLVLPDLSADPGGAAALSGRGMRRVVSGPKRASQRRREREWRNTSPVRAVPRQRRLGHRPEQDPRRTHSQLRGASRARPGMIPPLRSRDSGHAHQRERLHLGVLPRVRNGTEASQSLDRGYSSARLRDEPPADPASDAGRAGECDERGGVAAVLRRGPVPRTASCCAVPASGGSRRAPLTAFGETRSRSESVAPRELRARDRSSPSRWSVDTRVDPSPRPTSRPFREPERAGLRGCHASPAPLRGP